MWEPLTFRPSEIKMLKKNFERKIKMVVNCSRLRMGTVDTSFTPVQHSEIEILKKKFRHKIKMVPNRSGRFVGSVDTSTFRNRDVKKIIFRTKNENCSKLIRTPCENCRNLTRSCAAFKNRDIEKKFRSKN